MTRTRLSNGPACPRLLIPALIALTGCAATQMRPAAMTEQITPRYAFAEELHPLLEELLGSELRIVSSHATNTLTISGPCALVEQAKDIVAQVDIPESEFPEGIDSPVLTKELIESLNEFIDAELEKEKANAQKRDR